ncbi:MAG: hypothetical protein ACFE96_18055 [Candidatus Hermodarchaeota archaeon]
MYYVADLFNINRLFQKFGGLHRSYQEKIMNLLNRKVSKTDQEFKALFIRQKDLDRLLFRSYSGLLKILKMKELEELCLQQYFKQKKSLTLCSEKINFWSPSYIQLVSEFNPFLSNLIIMQNKFLEIVTNEENPPNRPPLNLNTAIDKLDIYGFKSELVSAFKKYWTKSGALVREYRNLEQHYQTIIEHSFLQIEPDEKLVIYLPDNPNIRSIHQTTYNQHIEAIPFFERAFFDFHTLVEEIFSFLGYESTPIPQSCPMVETELVKGKKRTFALMICDPVKCDGLEFIQTEDRKIIIQQLKTVVDS